MHQPHNYASVSSANVPDDDPAMLSHHQNPFHQADHAPHVHSGVTHGSISRVPRDVGRTAQPNRPNAGTNLTSPRPDDGFHDINNTNTNDEQAPLTPGVASQHGQSIYLPPNPERQNAGFHTQLFATLRRQFLQKRRGWIITLLEILLPAVFTLILVIVNYVEPPEKHPAELFAKREEPFKSSLLRSMCCYNGDTAPELQLMIPPCSFSNQSFTCAEAGVLPVDNFCVIGGLDSINSLGDRISDFEEELEIPNLDDMILLKWMVRTVVPPSTLFWDNSNSFASLQNNGYLYFMPNDINTQTMRNVLSNRYSLFKYVWGGFFNNREEATPYVLDVANEGKTWALLQVNEVTERNLDYIIMTNRSGVPWLNLGPRELYPMGLGTRSFSKFYSNGFLSIQKAINDYYLLDVLQVSAGDINTGESPTRLTMQPMPLYDYNYNKFLELSLLVGPFVLVLAFLFPISQLAKRLVEEKEQRLREGTMIMGLTKAAFFSSWLIVYYCQMFFAALFVSLVQHLAITSETNFGVTFLMYLLFTVATINMAAMFATFFSKAKVAALVVPLLYFVVSIPVFAIPDGTHPAAYHSLSIFCPTALAVALRLQFGYQANRGIGVGGFNNELDIPYSFMYAILWTIGDAFLYVALMLYFDTIIPKEWGTTRHPLFFLRRRAAGGIWPDSSKKRKGDKSGTLSDEENEMDQLAEIDCPVNYMRNDAIHANRRCAIQDYPSVNSDATVSIYNLRKEFSVGGHHVNVAVDDLHLRIFPDGITVMLGHNGAGKTTVINMMTGMLPPTAGDVRIYGKSILHDMQDIRRDIGFCPQHNILWDDLTCMEHLQYFARLKGFSGSEVDDEAMEMLARVDLTEKKDVLSCNLSGGQKRKLSVAIAFMGRARLVLLDEPTAGMDVAARRHTWDVLKDMAKGRTILLTTHYMDEADLLGSDIAIMSKGSLHSYGTPMFLKNHLGTGYIMRVDCDSNIEDTNAILEELQSVVPGAELRESKGQEVSFSLPKEMTRVFPSAIRHMESPSVKNRHKIVSVSMAVATLEDVFLCIAHEEAREGKTEEEFKMGEQFERAEAFRALEECYVALQKRNENIAAMSLAAAQEGSESSLTDPRSSSMEVYKRQLGGMLMKRFNHARRDYFALVIQIVSPILCILIAMLLNLIQVPSTPLVYFDNSEYGSLREQTMIANNCENLDPYWSNSFRVFEDDQPTTFSLAQNLLETYDTHGERNERFMAFDCNNTYNNNAIFVNASSLIAAPHSINEFYQARARSATGDPGVLIRAATFPLPFSHREETQITGVRTLFSALFVLIPFSFIPSVFATFVVRERESKSKHLQFVSGVNFVIYWLGNFIFDIVSYFVTVIIAFLLFAIFQKYEYVGSAANFFATFMLFFLFGLSTLGMAYFVSYFFKSHSTAQTVTLLVCFISGFVLVVFIFFLQNISNASTTVSDILVFFFRLIPPYCLGDGLKNLSYSYGMSRYTGTQNPFKMSTTGWDLVYMAIEAVIFFSLAIIVDHPRHNEKTQQLKNYMQKECTAPNIPHEDEDVAQERYEVESGERDDDVVRVERLRKIFDLGRAKTKVAVENLSFGVKRGEVFGFLGTNGAGKTTTMSMLTTEIIPSCGQGFVGGFDVVANSEKTRRLIGYCPQFDAIMDLLTPVEHLRLFAALRGIPTETTEPVIDALINSCGLAQYRMIPSGRLSGGNKRKLSVAMALIGGPSIVFLDEPSAGMDPHARRQLWDVISFVSKHSSVLLTTHHLEEVDVLAHRVGIMDQGLLRCLGSLEHLKRKFGNGYELTIQVESLEGAEAAVEFMFTRYPEAVLVEARQQRMLFTMPFDSTDLASLFQTIQEASEDPSTGIVDYIVQQTSLEQVFMRISAMKAAEDEEEAGAIGDTDHPTDMTEDDTFGYEPTSPNTTAVGMPGAGYVLPNDPNDPVYHENGVVRQNNPQNFSRLAGSAMYAGSVFNHTGMMSASNVMRQSQYRSVTAALQASMNFGGSTNGKDTKSRGGSVGARSVSERNRAAGSGAVVSNSQGALNVNSLASIA